MPVLVLVTGTGRSGTSTMSGTLHHLGLSVPGPYLQSNDSNPRGFFESRWSVRFHNELNLRAGVNLFDSRPHALNLVQDAITPRDRQRLRKFLLKHAAPQVVVKDPRTAFTQRLWREEAAEVGLETKYVFMLRHPAEVVGSRTTYYAARGADGVRAYQITNLARWVNATLISERETRGCPRSFVPYVDLLTDWRGVMTQVGANLGLTYNADLDSREPHPVDDFIEPSLRRHAPNWAEMAIPGDLTELAEQVWGCVVGLVGADGVDDDASRQLDELTEGYAELLADSSAVCHDLIAEARSTGRDDRQGPADPGLRGAARRQFGRVPRPHRRGPRH